ncbi:hypothetical protein K435DRAFT_278413 [Dendrothele bispora CBS 962.96]|uniref:Uncharacterized protein n=1 Tax=Dendrothele bispora (strain CBS 962.96) TaxID=1314807 RepID=A0A4V4HHP0_DENBC|nr:hypothetical protein K435DRAFT_278413 [Dendrothele bispora CBS 962.96]
MHKTAVQRPFFLIFGLCLASTLIFFVRVSIYSYTFDLPSFSCPGPLIYPPLNHDWTETNALHALCKPMAIYLSLTWQMAITPSQINLYTDIDPHKTATVNGVDISLLTKARRHARLLPEDFDIPYSTCNISIPYRQLPHPSEAVDLVTSTKISLAFLFYITHTFPPLNREPIHRRPMLSFQLAYIVHDQHA